MGIIRDTQGIVPGPSTRGGWVRPLSQLVDQLEADVTGLKERLRRGLRGGVPAAYSAKRVFLPEQATVSGTAWNVAQPLNYVVRDAETYDVPVVFAGPGVFLARKITVSVTQRLFCPAYGAPVQLAMSSVDMPVLGQNMTPEVTTAVGAAAIYFLDGVRLDWTNKISLFPTLPALPNNFVGGGAYVTKPGMNYVWNIMDSKSGAWLSSDFVSHLALLPRTFQPVTSKRASPFPHAGLDYYQCIQPPIYDGSFFYFDSPWLMERDGQLNFRFRPHTPVLQYDSSVNLATDLGVRSMPFDDRENGLRNQAVTVQVEIHGRRYESVQDLKHAGALSR